MPGHAHGNGEVDLDEDGTPEGMLQHMLHDQEHRLRL